MKYLPGLRCGEGTPWGCGLRFLDDGSIGHLLHNARRSSANGSPHVVFHLECCPCTWGLVGPAYRNGVPA